MTANAAQASPTQHVAASRPSSGRRSPPTAVLLPIERPVSQRWRERPRCPALRLAPGPWRRGRSRHRRPCAVSLSVQPVSSGRNAPPTCRCAWSCLSGQPTREISAHIGKMCGQLLPESVRRPSVPIARLHHRAFESRAVLGVVNALRCASTRHRAGPAGIDDACARHVHGPLRDGRNPGGVDGREKSSRSRGEVEVDAGFRQAYVDVSRLCRTAHPPHCTQCMRSAFPVVALRARFKRTLTTSRLAAGLSRCA